MALPQKKSGSSSQNISVPAQGIPGRHLSQVWSPSSTNRYFQHRLIVLVSFQLRCKGTFKQVMSSHIPQCRNGSSQPPGNRSRVAFRATLCTRITVQRSKRFNDTAHGVWKRHAKQRGTRGRRASPKGRLPDRKLSSFEFLSINICLKYKWLTDQRHTGGARGRVGPTACRKAAASTGRCHKSAGACSLVSSCFR